MKNLFMGHRSYGEPILRGDISNVYVGKYTSIAQGVIFDCGFHHNTKAISTYPFQAMNHKYAGFGTHPVSKGDIIIGNDVWIGEGALIMGGVIIGDGSVIGARSVVTRSVSPYCIVAGVPTKYIGRRFDKNNIDKILEIKWWDWPDETVEKYIPLLVSGNLEGFFNQCDLMKLPI